MHGPRDGGRVVLRVGGGVAPGGGRVEVGAAPAAAQTGELVVPQEGVRWTAPHRHTVRRLRGEGVDYLIMINPLV